MFQCTCVQHSGLATSGPHRNFAGPGGWHILVASGQYIPTPVKNLGGLEKIVVFVQFAFVCCASVRTTQRGLRHVQDQQDVIGYIASDDTVYRCVRAVLCNNKNRRRFFFSTAYFLSDASNKLKQNDTHIFFRIFFFRRRFFCCIKRLLLGVRESSGNPIILRSCSGIDVNKYGQLSPGEER